ncbi:hypothetical protein TrRE_jg10054, partial [Triparma retinervis]
ICAGQVITDLPSCVKELIENSLDSKATFIRIKLKDGGKEEIEVSDDGKGIAPNDRSAVCGKHTTSKLQNFEDLYRDQGEGGEGENSVDTFGFRGEAMNSICSVSRGVSIITKCPSESIGSHVSYGRDGSVSGSSPQARSRGTTVKVLG